MGLGRGGVVGGEGVALEVHVYVGVQSRYLSDRDLLQDILDEVAYLGIAHPIIDNFLADIAFLVRVSEEIVRLHSRYVVLLPWVMLS